MKSTTITPLALAIGSALTLGSVQAATITVDTLDDSLSDDTCSLRAALASINAQEALYGCSAPDGIDDEIVFGDLTGTIELTGEQLEILEPAIISGPGAELLEISGQEQSRVLLVQADSTISGVTVSNGDPGSDDELFTGGGGGVYLNETYADLTLEDCRLTNNVATYGGGLAVGAGRAIVQRCEISGNSASVMGGGAWVDGSLNERIGLYMIPEYGYQAYARLDMVESLVTGNEAGLFGGGLAAGRSFDGFELSVPPDAIEPIPLEPVANLSQPNLSLERTVVSGNIGEFNGGIIARGFFPVRHAPHYPALRNRVEIRDESVVSSNVAEFYSAGVMAGNSDLLIENSTIQQNVCGEFGTGGVSFGALYADDALRGSLVLDPQLVIQSSVISENLSTVPHPIGDPPYDDNYYLTVGGLYIRGGSHQLDNVLITGNQGWHVGGAVFGRRTIGSMARSTVSQNTGITGGLLVDLNAQSDLNLTHIENNEGLFVGGLSCDRGSLCQVGYSSITGNSGEVGGIGSDIYELRNRPFIPHGDWEPEEPQLTFESSTVSSNIGTRVGGIDAENLTLRFATVTSNRQIGELPTSQGEDPPDPVRPPAAGVLTDGSTSVFDHSIVSDNASEMSFPDVVVLEQPLPVSFSVLGSVDPSTLAASNSYLQVSAQLEPLQANGSEWNLSHLPYPGSPAINAGDPNIQNAPQFDQRGPGFDRILDGRINIGAVEGVAAGLPGEAVPVSVMGRVATGLLAGGILLMAWLGLRRTAIDRRIA